MLIDWFTVAAQVVNFLVLVWLLKRFLYRPVLDAIDARERRIADELAAAAQQRASAGEQRADFEARSHALEQQRDALLAAARQSADQERAAILAGARDEHDELRRKLAAELAEHSAALVQTVAARALDEVVAVTRRLLAELADADLEERIVATFIRRLRGLSEADRARLRSAAAGGRLEIRSAFELPAARQREISAELRRLTAVDCPLLPVRSKELLGGVELWAEGYCLRWSITEYLQSLRGEFERTLNQAEAG